MPHPYPSPESARGEASLLGRQAAVNSYQLYTVPWFDGVHQVVVDDDFNRAGKLAGRSLLRHLLDGHGLVVLVGTQAILCLQWVVLLVLERESFNHYTQRCLPHVCMWN